MPRLKIARENAVEFRDVSEIVTIGQDPKNHIQVQGERVSEQHCQIRYEGKSYKLTDNMSRYGTYVNGVPVRESLLRHGDTIVVGDVVFTFYDEPRAITTKRRRRVIAGDSLIEEFLAALFKIDEPIELGRGGYQNYDFAPIDDFREWLGAMAAALFLRDDREYRLVSHAGLDAMLNPARLLLLTPLLSRLKETTEIQQITDFEKLGLYLDNTPCAEIARGLAAPLRPFKTKAVASFAVEQPSEGMLFFFYNRGKKKFTPDELLMVRALTHQLVTRISNMNLFLRASSDSLTHLYNRGFFENTFASELKKAQSRSEFLSVALVDMDYFRHFNEQYGVREGDNLLSEVARLITEHLSVDDVAARYGVEKFVVLLPRQSAIRAYNWAENVRKAVAQHPFNYPNISVSIGISTFPDNAATAEEMIKRADQALYRAKFEGRNKTVFYDQSVDHGGSRTDHLAGLISGNAAKDYGNTQMLVETVNIMASYSNFNQLVEELVDKVLEITHAERAIVFLGETPEQLRIHFGRNVFKQRISSIEQYSTTIPRKVIEKGEPICVVDEMAGQQDTSLSMAQFELRTVMCAPLRDKERKVFGVLYVDSQVQQRKYEISDLIFFETISKQIALALENAKLHQMAAERERLQHEVQLASQIQQRFLPQPISGLAHFNIYGRIWPALEVGGDYYDFIRTPDDKLYICIGDVSGKGLGSGLIMVMAHTGLHTLVKQGTGYTCAQIMFHLNNLIYANTDIQMFMSMLLIQIDLASNTISYSGAGHEHLIIYRAKKRTCERRPAGGLVLGIRQDQEYLVHTLDLGVGDRLFLYTDGATEALSDDNRQFGLDNLVALVEHSQTLDSEKLCQCVYQRLCEFMGKQKQYDDITLVVLEKKEKER